MGLGCGCEKCRKCCTWVLLVIGVLYLLQDMGKIAWWTYNWWTVVFLLYGVTGLAKANCKACQAMRKKK